MGRLLTLIMLIILGTVACVRTVDKRTQDDRPLAELDGLRWRPMAHKDKMTLMLGAMVGSTTEQILAKRDVAHHGATVDLVRELDAFYDVSANVPIPLYAALAYTFKKLDGVESKEDLDKLLKRYRELSIQGK